MSYIVLVGVLFTLFQLQIIHVQKGGRLEYLPYCQKRSFVKVKSSIQSNY